MAGLFDKSLPTINEHIKNVYKEKELSRGSTIRKSRIVQFEGGRQVERLVEFYNLDVIISVGYRVKSNRGTQFRIWATKVLKEHLITGYTINQKRLLEQKDKLLELQRAIKIIQEKSQDVLLEGQTQELLSIIADYSNSLSLLNQYDEGKLALIKSKKAKFVLTYSDCQRVVAEIKRKILARKEAGELFGVEASQKFQAVVGALYQTFGGKELYSSLEEKAANLLYLTIKDHPFVDGNKRIASILFIYFLECNDFLRKANSEKKINDNALTALALLIAISEAKEKETIIKIITNLLKS